LTEKLIENMIGYQNTAICYQKSYQKTTKSYQKTDWR